MEGKKNECVSTYRTSHFFPFMQISASEVIPKHVPSHDWLHLSLSLSLSSFHSRPIPSESFSTEVGSASPLDFVSSHKKYTNYCENCCQHADRSASGTCMGKAWKNFSLRVTPHCLSYPSHLLQWAPTHPSPPKPSVLCICPVWLGRCVLRRRWDKPAPAGCSAHSVLRAVCCAGRRLQAFEGLNTIFWFTMADGVWESFTTEIHRRVKKKKKLK